MTAILEKLLITVKVNAFEKISFSDTQNPKTIFNTLALNDKHYRLNRDNLARPIHIQLSQKQKIFSEFFFFAFLKSILNFKHLTKKDDPHR